MEFSNKFGPNSRVIIRSTGSEGVVLRAARRGAWLVAIGSLKRTFKQNELELIDQTSFLNALPSRKIEIEVNVRHSNPVIELNVHGMRLEEALNLVERQVDNAILTRMAHFTILHGKGLGILRRAIREYLKNRNDVLRFNDSLPHEGGVGKTVVWLK